MKTTNNSNSAKTSNKEVTNKQASFSEDKKETRVSITNAKDVLKQEYFKLQHVLKFMKVLYTDNLEFAKAFEAVAKAKNVHFSNIKMLFETDVIKQLFDIKEITLYAGTREAKTIKTVCKKFQIAGTNTNVYLSEIEVKTIGGIDKEFAYKPIDRFTPNMILSKLSTVKSEKLNGIITEINAKFAKLAKEKRANKKAQTQPLQVPTQSVATA